MDAETRQVCEQWMPAMAGSMLVCGVVFVDQSMSAMLVAGSVAALMYATRIVSAVAGLASTSLGTAVTPYFSKMIANGQLAECRRTLRTYRRITIAVAVPITIILVVFSRPLVTLLYQRGAFTAADTVVVARAQSMLCLQIPFYAMSMLHVRLISSLKRNTLLFYGAAINLSFDVVLNLICMKYWGVAGIALATSLYYVVSCTFVVFAAQWALNRAVGDAQPAFSVATGSIE
jgi:putative peptidoglycan lipid II flippase